MQVSKYESCERVGLDPLFLRNKVDFEKGVINMTKEIEKKVEELVLPICDGMGLSLWAVDYAKEAGSWFLRVYIDRESGVSIDDCVRVSRKLEELLDAKDFIDSSYMLEVGSPGIDRPLKRPEDFKKFAGEYVNIKLYKAQNKVKNFQGKLRGLEADMVTIETDDGQFFAFELSSIASCRLAVIF